MKRKLFALILAWLVVVMAAGCGANKAALESYELELSALENAELQEVISKKSELDAIINDESASIFKGDDKWEFEEGSLNSSDSYSKVFTLAEIQMTVSVRINDGKVWDVSYELSRCSEADALEIYNLIVDMYGEPSTSELGKGAIDGIFAGIDSFTWIGENGVIGMIYSPDFNTINLI